MKFFSQQKFFKVGVQRDTRQMQKRGREEWKKEGEFKMTVLRSDKIKSMVKCSKENKETITQ